LDDKLYEISANEINLIQLQNIVNENQAIQNLTSNLSSSSSSDDEEKMLRDISDDDESDYEYEEEVDKTDNDTIPENALAEIQESNSTAAERKKIEKNTSKGRRCI
jgi:hypothetical protein